jgi:hypothetical protein
MAYYQAALTVDPANILARSYMGQGFVTLGQTELAQAELSEIRKLGGGGTWAEHALAQALRSGTTYSY